MAIFPKIMGSDIFTLSDQVWAGIRKEQIFGFRDRQYGFGVYDDFSDLSLRTAISTGVAYYNSEGHTYRTYEKSNNSTSTQALQSGGGTYTVPTGLPITTPFGSNPPNTNTQNTAVTALYPAGAIIPTPGQLQSVLTASNADFLQMAMGPVTTGTGAATSYCLAPFTPYLASSQTGVVVVFECRVKFTTIDTNTGGFFVGLGSGDAYAMGTSVTPLASDTAFATTPDLLGFGWLSGGTRYTLNTVYNVAGGTVQTSAMSLMTTQKIAGGGVWSDDGTTLTRAAYVKLGFRYDSGSGIFTPFLNGIPFSGNYLPNKTILGTTTTGATWPAHPMTLALGMGQKASNGTVNNFTMDWWACAQTQG